MAVFNLEARAPYWKDLQFVWFVDAGNVFERASRHPPARAAADQRPRLPLSLADRTAARGLGLEAEHAAAAKRRPRAFEVLHISLGQAF